MNNGIPISLLSLNIIPFSFPILELMGYLFFLHGTHGNVHELLTSSE